MGKGIKTQVKLNSRRLILTVMFDDNNKHNANLTCFFKILVDNYLCLSIPKGNLNCSNEKVLSSLMFYIMSKVKL